ncbi:MAG: 2TM domain-containing protein [Chitinophagaceae bacterium]|jgi:hypothetical protein|nr:2TM domain-containing protein [Chitinophagaceae bacterium]
MNQQIDQPQDQQLWEIARQRAAFKKNLVAYVLVNLFLVGVWYFSNGGNHRYFWPIWPILGWGLGLAIQYASAYHGNRLFSAEKEYDQLKRKQQ